MPVDHCPIPSRQELRHIADLIKTAHTDHDSWISLRNLRSTYRSRERTALGKTGANGSDANDTNEWPDVLSPSFLDRIRANRSLHVPQFLRGNTLLRTHQILNRTFMGPGTGYNGILLIHSTGSGKTRTAVEICEQYVGVMKNRACVITPPNLQTNFTTEVASSSKARYHRGRWEISNSRGAYVRAANRVTSPLIQDLDVALARTISQRYEVLSWSSFVTRWTSGSSGDRLRDFSDRVYVVDEAHNLRHRSSSTDFEKEVTRVLMEIAGSCFNVKFVIMTATPMVDRAEEVIGLVNILRHNDDLPLLSVDDVFPKGVLDEGKLRTGVRGYVSVYHPVARDPQLPVELDVRTANVRGLNLKWPKKAIDGSKSLGEVISMVHVAATPLQVEFFRAWTESVSNEQGVTRAIEASNATYEGGLVGRPGFKSMLDSTGTYVDGRFGPKDLPRISPKVASLIDAILASEGVILVYTAFVWAGVKIVAAALEERGFRPINVKAAVTRAATQRSTTGPVYATITAETDINSVVKLCSSPQNCDGSLVKVVICTKSGTEGLDFKHVRELHILDGWWNRSRESQMVGRAVRMGSHNALPPDKRNVTVVRYGLTLQGREGIDHFMARLAWQKQLMISKVFDILRSESFDCVAYQREMAASVEELATDRPSVQITSRGNTVRLREDEQVKKRIASMCGEHADVVDLRGDWVDGAHDPLFGDIVGVVRDRLGGALEFATIYSLSELVDLSKLPDDLCTIALTEILRNGSALTPANPEEPAKHLEFLGEDEYALREFNGGRNVIVTIPMTTVRMASDWKHVSLHIRGVLGRMLKKPLDDAIVDDMATLRSLRAGMTVEEIVSKGGDRASASLRKLNAVPQIEGAIFTAREKSAFDHLTRLAVEKVLVSNSLPLPPTKSSKSDASLYAEYLLRSVGMFSNPGALYKRQNDGNDDDDHAGEQHAVGRGD